jgi:hypothetical protein
MGDTGPMTPAPAPPYGAPAPPTGMAPGVPTTGAPIGGLPSIPGYQIPSQVNQVAGWWDPTPAWGTGLDPFTGQPYVAPGMSSQTQTSPAPLTVGGGKPVPPPLGVDQPYGPGIDPFTGEPYPVPEGGGRVPPPLGVDQPYGPGIDPFTGEPYAYGPGNPQWEFDQQLAAGNYVGFNNYSGITPADLLAQYNALDPQLKAFYDAHYAALSPADQAVWQAAFGVDAAGNPLPSAGNPLPPVVTPAEPGGGVPVKPRVTIPQRIFQRQHPMAAYYNTLTPEEQAQWQERHPELFTSTFDWGLAPPVVGP